jgi:hypothetical protein
LERVRTESLVLADKLMSVASDEERLRMEIVRSVQPPAPAGQVEEVPPPQLRLVSRPRSVHRP